MGSSGISSLNIWASGGQGAGSAVGGRRPGAGGVDRRIGLLVTVLLPASTGRLGRRPGAGCAGSWRSARGARWRRSGDGEPAPDTVVEPYGLVLVTAPLPALLSRGPRGEPQVQ